jgi:hypothetical protein
MPRHNISNADQLFYGSAQHNGANNAKRGIPFTPLTQIDFGAPLTLDADGLLAAATSTELPNTETVTYLFPAVSASPQDGANLTGIMDVPRNITAAVTHGSSVVAMTILVTGYDVYNTLMSELLTITATGTSKAAAGLKAFKRVISVAITAAADAEANTLNLGWGDVLGFPYRLGGAFDLAGAYCDSTMEQATSTVVAGVATTATTTTGDVRGTIDFATASNGTRRFRAWMKVYGAASKTEAYGVPQA